MTTVWHQYDTYFSIECGKVKSYLENDENIVGKPQVGQFEKKNKNKWDRILYAPIVLSNSTTI